MLDLPSADGKRQQAKRRGFPTKRAAQEALDKLKAESSNGLLVEPSRLTVGAFLTEDWLPTIQASVRPTTLDTYDRLGAFHIVPSLGGVRLQGLERAQIARWLSELSSSDLSAKSVRNVHAVLNKALADAVELDLGHATSRPGRRGCHR